MPLPSPRRSQRTRAWVVWVLPWLAGLPGMAGAAMPGVPDEALARQHYMLQCQGCHRPEGTGTPSTTPTMAGLVSRFLQVPGGREYLGRVPGVATAALNDRDLAALLNWTLFRFDPDNVPAGFKPYTAEEIGLLRRRPLRVEAADQRARLMAALDRLPPGGR